MATKTVAPCSKCGEPCESHDRLCQQCGSETLKPDDTATRQEAPRGLRNPLAETPTDRVIANALASDFEVARTQLQVDGSENHPDEDRERDHELRGVSIGRFIVIDVAGEGGMGMVMSAYDPMLNRRVAIKILTSDREGATERLLREAQAMAKIQHLNVVTVYDAGEHEEQVFIAMEFVEGGTFRDWMQKRPDHNEPGHRQDVLEILVPAGRGLAAAHHSDLVHRDFKPENILLSERGEVKVADFGLVSVSAVETFEELDDLQITANGRLTVAGTILGTPLYMAPEQFDGTDVDSRADQFAFCVVLHEALFGVLPFKADSILGLAREVRNAKIVAPPEESGIPGWLQKLVYRGLSGHPSDRFPSMDALLDELTRDRRNRFARIGLVAAVVLAAGGTAWALQGNDSRESVACHDSHQQLVSVWDPGVQKSIQEAFVATGARYADSVWRTVRSALDDHSSEWTSMRTTACEATHVHRTQSIAVMDLRMACLDRRLHEMNALTSRLSQADTEMLNHAVEAALGLKELDRCSRTAVVAMGAAEKIEPALKSQVEALQVQIREALVAGELGDYAQGSVAASEVFESASSIGVSSVAAEAGLTLGRFQWKQGKLESSVDSLISALVHAQNIGDELMKQSIYSELIYVLGFELANWQEALRWGRLAEAALPKLAESSRAKAMLYFALGTAETRALHLEAALERFEASRDAIPNKPGQQLLRARSLMGLGSLSAWTGDFEKAIRLSKNALQIQVEALGEGHPETSVTLVNLGCAYASIGNYKEARVRLEQALRITEAAFGEEHQRVADALNNLGAVDLEQERYQSAVSHLERAVAIIEKIQGPEHPDLATSLLNLGTAYLLLERPTNAVSSLERALRVVKSGTASPSQIAQVQFTLAQALDQAGDSPLRARQLAELAGIAYESLPESSEEVVEIRDWLAGLSRR